MSKQLIWTDVTSYSRGERGTVPPRAWETRVSGLRIVVHRHRDYGENDWLLSVYDGVRIDMHLLKAVDLDKAQGEALKLLRAQLREWISELS